MLRAWYIQVKIRRTRLPWKFTSGFRQRKPWRRGRTQNFVRSHLQASLYTKKYYWFWSDLQRDATSLANIRYPIFFSYSRMGFWSLSVPHPSGNIVKPDGDNKFPKNYHSMNLLSCMSNVVEVVILSRFQHEVVDNEIIQNESFEFWARHFSNCYD